MNVPDIERPFRSTFETDEREQRLAALLMTVPGWQRNYTASLDAAKWIVKEAENVGWTLTIAEERK